jgi:N-acetylglucosaminyl-diphospho-decaprenol L-rhamnosyltransferase
MSSSVTALVVSYESALALPECIAALQREDARVLIIDNASHDGSADLAQTLGAGVLRNVINEGYGRANNRGARATCSEWLLICNPDAILDSGALASLLKATKRFPDAGLYAPRLVEPDGRVFFQAQSLLARYLPNPRAIRMVPEGDVCAPFLSGACFLIRRDLFLELCGFDEAIFLFYEDDDLCRRLTDQGYSLVYVHDAIVRHGRGRSSAPTIGRLYRSRWHQAWSRVYISRKYGLSGPAWSMMTLSLGKLALGLFALSPARMARHAGTCGGLLAAWRKKPAL